VHATIDELQAALDAWVTTYNHDRPNQSFGDRPPAERFSLAGHRMVAVADADSPEAPEETSPAERPPGVGRWVDQRGTISVTGTRYRVGPTYAGEPVEVVVQNGMIEILHAGVLVASHVERRRPEARGRIDRSPRQGHSRPATSGMAVIRVVDTSGSVSFAGGGYRGGRSWGRRQVEVAIVAGSVQISCGSGESGAGPMEWL
jgi:hypothetical protein